MMSTQGTGRSATASAFGAKIAITTGSWALCLVEVRRSPAAALNTVGAKLLASRSATKVIALVDMALFAQLRAHPDVARAGSISIDPARFARFQQLVGLPG